MGSAHDIIDYLRDIRYAKQIPQKAMARKLHVSQQTFSEWERGYTSPQLDKVVAWARWLGYELDLKERYDEQSS